MRHQLLPSLRNSGSYLISVNMLTNASVLLKLITLDETAKTSYGRNLERSLWYWEKWHRHQFLYLVQQAFKKWCAKGFNASVIHHFALCKSLKHETNYLSTFQENHFVLRISYRVCVLQKKYDKLNYFTFKPKITLSVSDVTDIGTCILYDMNVPRYSQISNCYMTLWH